MSDAKLIASTKEFIPVRLVQTEDQWAWKKFGMQGIGLFLVLNHKAEQHVEIPMRDARPKAVIASFVTTLTKAWSELKDEVKGPAWQTNLDAAQAAAAKSGKPIALLMAKGKLVKRDDGEGNEIEEFVPDKKGAAVKTALKSRAVAAHLDRYVWVRANWTASKPAAAKRYSLSRAPTLAIIGADGKKVSARLTKFQPAKLASALSKYATKAEAAAARARKRAESERER